MKKLYTSYGTYGFLNQIKINNPSHHLFQFSTADSSVIFEETEENTADRQTYEDFKNSDAFKDHFSKEALSHYFGSSGQHSSYFERYLYPIKE
ncbi:hypothetical protein PU976_09145 [Staphylococcus aureus]|nr:hypothetical protein PU976_09145 [Staphylococcus aureus]